MSRIFLFSIFSTWLTAASLSSAGAEVAEVKFPPAGLPATQDAKIPSAIPGKLTMPDGVAGKMPAVVIVHGSGGVDGRSAWHAEALNAAGIATLEIDMWTPRGIGKGMDGVKNRPSNSLDTLPDAYGALSFLANHERIDGARVGIMGFSYGAAVAVQTANLAATEAATGGKYRFTAHAPFYLVCWPYSDGQRQAFIQATMTGAPILLQVGGADDYDNADGGETCRRVVDSLPEANRKLITLQVHKGATHGWDGRGSQVSFYDKAAFGGKGGSVTVAPDRTVAEASRTAAVEFFKNTFGK